MASTILKRAINFTPPVFARTHRAAKTNDLYSTINLSGPANPNNIPLPTPMPSTILKKALSFKPIKPPILARTHRTAKTNNLYSTINLFGSADPNNIPLPTPMTSTILKKPLNFTPIITPLFARTFCAAKRNDLYNKIIYVDDPNLIVPLLEQWVGEGNNVKEHELQYIVQDLYENQRFEKAAQVFQWVSSKGLPFSLGENYVQLDLIGRVHGLEAAESYFNNLNDEDKIYTVYHTLLKFYFEEGLVDKCITHLQKMMDLGFLYTASCYNDLLFLYAVRGQFEKIHDVLSDMKVNGVSPDDFSYRICIHAFGAKSDISSMELILKEMENQPHNNIDWTTHATVANVYIKAGVKEKALIYLDKCSDELVYLLSMQYIRNIIMRLGRLVDDGELEEAKKFIKEWERYLLTPMGGECKVNNGHIEWAH